MNAYSGLPETGGPAPEVSAVIVNWNTRELLRDCLGTLLAQTRARSLEVIVVDNASEDGSAEMVRREFPSVRLLVNSKNLGFAAGCNQGLRESTGRQLLLLNSDTRLEEDAISGLAAFLDAQPKAGLVSCTLLNADGTLQPSCGYFPSLWGTVAGQFRRDRGPHRDFFYPWLSFDEHRRCEDVDWVAGAVMLARRETVEQVGLLDDSIFLFAEEWDWCYRIRAAGWRILATRDVRVVHLGSGSWVFSNGLLSQSRRAGQFSFFRKHYGLLRAGALHLVAAIGAAGRTAAAALLWLSPGGRASATQRLKQNWAFLRWAFSPAALQILRGEDLAAWRGANADRDSRR